MELVFNEELEKLIDSLKDLKLYIEDTQVDIEDEINYEVDCKEQNYGCISDYEYEEIKSNIEQCYKNEFEEFRVETKDLIVSYIKELPNTFNPDNCFAIGKLRREEILYLLSKAKDIMDFVSLYDIRFLNEIISEVSNYLTKDNKTLVNERKRVNRRNEFGLTKREQQKQETINSIMNLKDNGLIQSQVCSKLGLSKGLVSRYWNAVYSSGKWEIPKKQNKFEINKIIVESNEADEGGEIILDCDDPLYYE